jgi:uncharacterized membrane protein
MSIADGSPHRRRIVVSLCRLLPALMAMTLSAAFPPISHGQTDRSPSKSALKVLLVTERLDNERDWRPLFVALGKGGIDVTTLRAPDVPRDVAKLVSFNAILFCNVACDEFHEPQLQAVRDAVVSHGVGFLMTGGPNSFGPGGYRHSVIEEILPVTMETASRGDPGSAVVLILDTSHFPDGRMWGKQVSSHAAEVLGANDLVGVLARADGKVDWIIPLASTANHPAMSPTVYWALMESLRDFQRPMELGLEALGSGDAKSRRMRRMIVVSDGSPSLPSPALLQKILDARVSLTMIAVFPPGGRDLSKMPAIAAVTGGRYYAPESADELLAIVNKETRTLRRSLLSDDTFTPAVAGRSPVLEGLGEIPRLKGYSMTMNKDQSATRILVVPAGPEGITHPLLTIGKSGRGKAAAFTADFSTTHNSNWHDWDQFPRLTRHLIAEISNSERRDP